MTCVCYVLFPGDPTKPQSWSKYSEDSNAFKKKNVESEAVEQFEDKKEKKKKKKEKKPVDELVKKVN